MRSKHRLGQKLWTPPFADAPAQHQVIGPASDCFSVSRLLIGSKVTPNTSMTWPGTGFPVAFPFWMPYDFTVFQLAWWNGGGTMTDAADFGIYDSAFARQVAAGSTVHSGVNTWQVVDVADTACVAGKYFAVLNNNGTTAQQYASWAVATAAALALLGVQDKASADFVLPATLTGMAASATFTQIPQFSIALRALF